jgi:hypothetical protein
MLYLKILVVEAYKFESKSRQVGRPVSPRGGIYLSGRQPEEDDTVLHYISTGSDKSYLSCVALNHKDELVGDLKMPDLCSNDLGLDNPMPKYETKLLASLENRYRQMARQEAFNFLGSVTIILDLCNENSDRLSCRQVTCDITEAKDFNKVWQFLQKDIKRAPAVPEDMIPPRAISALRV